MAIFKKKVLEFWNWGFRGILGPKTDQKSILGQTKKYLKIPLKILKNLKNWNEPRLGEPGAWNDCGTAYCLTLYLFCKDNGKDEASAQFSGWLMTCFSI